jgi:hypothetical protein
MKESKNVRESYKEDSDERILPEEEESKIDDEKF